MKEGSRTVALGLTLLLLAGVLAVVSAGLTPHATPSKTVARRPSHGTLLVRVIQTYGTNDTSLAVPVANVSVAVSKVSTVSVIPLEYQTNSSGEIAVQLGGGSYTVSISDAQFQKSTNVTIDANSETEVNATVIKHSYLAFFSDLLDPYSSATVAPWSFFWLAVASTPGVPLNGSLFVDTLYEGSLVRYTVNGSAGAANLTDGPVVYAQPIETPVRIISSGLQAYGGSEVLWLTLQPEDFMPISGLLSLDLATYSATLQMTIHAD